MQTWKPLPLRGDETEHDAIRLNALGSLFFFVGYVLKKHRLSRLHKQLCKSLESEDLHSVIEMPMLHFKTTVANEGLSMWWALPFTDRDEFMMRAFGYGDEWIRWMKKAHDQNARTLITHETMDLAVKVGKAVDDHYHNNDVFRRVFPEIIPTNETWNNDSKYHKRTDSSHSEGTYEYRGSGQSVQGLHMTGIIEDDNVGKAAQDSLLKGDARVMNDVIAYHRLVSTRFDPAYFTKSVLGRQLVIGNRWAPYQNDESTDLNGWIRKNQPEFTMERHSAEGGCCALHPPGVPIFPEEFDMERLATMRRTFGSFNYSHFFLNEEVMQEDFVFQKDWLRYYRYKPSNPNVPLNDPTNFLMIEYEVRDGEVIEDIPAGVLSLRMIIDLAHAKKKGRCKHVILITGLDGATNRLHLLDVWAEPSGYKDLVDNMYMMAGKWGIREAWLETVAAQNILKFYFDEKNRTIAKPLYIRELPYDNSDNAKTNRIESMEPTYRTNNFWCHRAHTEFIDEYLTYHRRKVVGVDVLDTIGYVPMTYEGVIRRELVQRIRQREEDFKNRNVGVTGY